MSAAVHQQGVTRMPFQRMDIFTLIAVVIVMAVMLVLVNTVGVNALVAADVHMPHVGLMVDNQPAANPPDNTALWIALISSLTLNFFNLVQGMFGTWMQFKIKVATKDMQQTLDVNTVITQQTRNEVTEARKEGQADKSNDRHKGK